MRSRLLVSICSVAFALLVAAIPATDRSVATALQQQTERVPLFYGCNNVALTWPPGTPPRTIALASTPAGALLAIWRFDNVTQRFAGYSPAPGAPNDLLTVNRLDPVFVCVGMSAMLTRPVLVPVVP